MTIFLLQGFIVANINIFQQRKNLAYLFQRLVHAHLSLQLVESKHEFSSIDGSIRSSMDNGQTSDFANSVNK